MKKIAVLGSTGSIGVQTLNVILEDKDNFELVLITAHKQINLFKDQILLFKPKYAVLTDLDSFQLLHGTDLGSTKLIYSMNSILDIIDNEDIDLVLNSLVGSIGILPTYHTLKRGIDLALANKESLVAGGEVIFNLSKNSKSRIIPVDSEHNAIFQCLYGNKVTNVEKLILTASGGPFRGWKWDDLVNVTSSRALMHPNWSMGRKISIDSSTLVNKGLEVIEARWLFDIPTKDIEVVIHPQSIIHSMVMYKDGSIIAQMGNPDMKHPIHSAIYYPERIENKFKRFDFFNKTFTFEKPDLNVFPGLKLAFDAIEIGGSMPIVYNAVNEVMVDKFLSNKCKFYDITDRIRYHMENHKAIKNLDINTVLEIDSEFKKMVMEEKC
jgi:1-deoxy-D-xylulose-5-phosphate reductoisomerase